MSGPLIKSITFSLDDSGKIYMGDAIIHEGKPWVVTGWIENKDEKWRIPERIICFAGHPHQHTPNGAFGDYVLSQPLPHKLFDLAAQAQKGSKFPVLDRPDIRFPLVPPLQ